jgi:hypothetical protein
MKEQLTCIHLPLKLAGGFFLRTFKYIVKTQLELVRILEVTRSQIVKMEQKRELGSRKKSEVLF